MKTDIQKDVRVLVGYTFVILFCFAFGQIYEYFGYGVTSPFMHFAFLIPLFMGMVPRLALFAAHAVSPYARRTGADTYGNTPLTGTGPALWRLGIATLTTGSVFRGALDIYGTNSPLTFVYPVAGALCLVTGLTVIMVTSVRRNR